jgi:Outer membrane receptor for ferrienterochelin and colicins
MKKQAQHALPEATQHHRMFRPASAVSALIVASALAANLALADPVKATVSIPPQELAAALKSFASQTGSQVLFASDALQGARTRGASGSFTPEEALRLLLQGTPYTYRETGTNTFAIQVEKENKSDADRLPEVVVTATRTERAPTDVPASVSVISARDIERQQVAKTGDLLRNVEGIDLSASAGGSTGNLILRGVGGSFAGQTTQILNDGMQTDSIVAGIRGGLNFLPTQDIDRIEVVRGPASALYGPSAVGGVVNILPKRWRGGPGAEVRAEGGTHNSHSVGVAVGAAGDNFDFRLSATDFGTDGYMADTKSAWGKDLAPRDWDDRKIGLEAALRPSGHQELTLSARTYRINSAWLGGHPNYRYTNDGDSYALGYRHEFGDAATLKLRWLSARVKSHILFDDEAVNGTPGSLILAEVDQRTSNADTAEAQLDLSLSPRNTLTLGLSESWGRYESGATDILFGGTTVTVSKSDLTGFFVQDEHRFDNGVSVTVGGRYDHYRLYGDTRNGVSTNPESTDSVFNPRLGLRYRVSGATSLYASAGSAYVPALNYLKFRNSAAWLDNPGLQPETSTSYEVGVDHSLGWLSARAAVFHTDYRDKIAVIWVGARRQYQNIGEVRVDGFELAVEGKAGNGWQPYLNYAYTDSKIEENPSDPLTVGKRVQQVSPHKLNLGVVYTPNTRWMVRLGGRYVSDRYFDDRNTVAAHVGGYFVADAKINAKLPFPASTGTWEASLAVNNLFDKAYSEWRNEVADGRTVWLGINGRF